MKRIILSALLLVACDSSNSEELRDRSAPGESALVTQLPPTPGFPESVAVRGNIAYVSAPAAFGNPGPVTVYQVHLPTGNILQAIVPPGQAPGPKAASGLRFGPDGALYLIDVSRGIVRLRISATGQVTSTMHSTPFPDLPSCTATTPEPCSSTQENRTPLPNDLDFLPDGRLLVTDSFQGLVWQIPAGGGAPTIWVKHEAFDQDFGPNGIRVMPDGDVATALTLPRSTVLRLPVEDPEGFSVLHEYEPFSGPDGLTFGASGRLYVTLAGANQISVLEGNSELVRYSGPIQAASGPIPYDAPAGMDFDNAKKSLVVVNHSFPAGVPDHWVLFRVFVDDTGSLP